MHPLGFGLGTGSLADVSTRTDQTPSTDAAVNTATDAATSVPPGVPLPRLRDAAVAVAPPGLGAGYWSGGPSAQIVDGTTWLAYRLRRPIGSGRGYANVVARSEDGEQFETVTVLSSADFGAESLERPALVHTPEGRWRIYVSCATPGTKHWRVDVLEADHPAAFDPATRRTVLPGDDATGVKDPVVRWSDGRWHLWASCHPLALPAEADRMVTSYATSPDGLDWTWQGDALTGRPGAWDSRGVRISCVLLNGGAPVAYYDGRASALENWEERTGVALSHGPEGALGRFTAVGAAPALRSPDGPGGLRYLDVLPVGQGSYRIYYEVTRADGGHELRTEVVSTG
jgi:hypothetical protein